MSGLWLSRPSKRATGSEGPRPRRPRGRGTRARPQTVRRLDCRENRKTSGRQRLNHQQRTLQGDGAVADITGIFQESPITDHGIDIGLKPQLRVTYDDLYGNPWPDMLGRLSYPIVLAYGSTALSFTDCTMSPVHVPRSRPPKVPVILDFVEAPVGVSIDLEAMSDQQSPLWLTANDSPDFEEDDFQLEPDLSWADYSALIDRKIESLESGMKQRPQISTDTSTDNSSSSSAEYVPPKDTRLPYPYLRPDTTTRPRRKCRVKRGHFRGQD